MSATLADRIRAAALQIAPHRLDVSSTLVDIAVEVARLERAQRRPADVLPFRHVRPVRGGEPPKGAA